VNTKRSSVQEKGGEGFNAGREKSRLPACGSGKTRDRRAVVAGDAWGMAYIILSETLASAEGWIMGAQQGPNWDMEPFSAPAEKNRV